TDKTDSGLQASGVPVSAGPGIALPSRKTLGQEFDVTAPSGQTQRLKQTDVGPAAWTGRGVDINPQAAQGFGYTQRDFPTDQNFVVRQVTGPAAMQQAQSGVPMPAVKQSNDVANRAGAEISPQQYGFTSARDVMAAIDKASPDAPDGVKFLAAQ